MDISLEEQVALLENATIPEILEVIRRNVYVFERLNQSEELCLEVVKRYPHYLKDVKIQTPEICREAVTRSGMCIDYVKEQTPELCMIAVKYTGLALQYVKEQTPELCMIAVQNTGLALPYIKNQTYELSIVAVSKSGCALRHVKRHFKTPEIMLIAVKNSGFALDYVKKEQRTYELCLEAVTNNGYAVKYVPEIHLTTEIMNQSVRTTGCALHHIPESKWTYEMIKIALSSDGRALHLIKNQTEELCMIAIRNYPWAFMNVLEQTQALCTEAYKLEKRLLRLIKDEFKEALYTKLEDSIIYTQIDVFLQGPSGELLKDIEIVDPITLDNPEIGDIFGFVNINNKYYTVASTKTLNKFIMDEYKRTNEKQVYSPFHNTLIPISNITWIKF